MAKKEMKAAEAAVGMSRGTKILIAAMVVVMVAAIAVAVWAIFFREDIILTPDYAPPKKEENAEKIEGDDDTKLDAPEGGGAVQIVCEREITLDKSEKAAKFYFANPQKSTQQMVIQIVIQDTIIAQSGTLDPGYRIRFLNLLPDMEKMLAVGGYDAQVIILCYDPVTGEKSMVQQAIEVVVTVQE